MAYIYYTLAIISAMGGWFLVAGIFGVLGMLTMNSKDTQE